MTLTTSIRRELLLAALLSGLAAPAFAQPYGPPDRGAPGDEMIRAYLDRETAKIAAGWDADVASREHWEAKRPQHVEEYFYMLGLSPRPEKTPLEATVTGTLDQGDYVVELLHYQSRPGLYVTGNLYRPAEIKPGELLPAVFYVCGHSNRGRNGNKVAYQSHGIWFARHGYVCLVVDSLQLGEIAATHHGTYNLERWWWHSWGYTPAGVEAWNGVRGIDYLVSRPDVDPERIAVTGISGGGAATFWVAAADERVSVAVPVSGMADLESYVSNRVINGHCDCMFLYNTFRWPWTRIAGLVAPRPQLFVNSDDDHIFPMDANERIINRLERLYRLYGAGDRVDAVVSVGGHAYREDIRQAAYRFINAHLKGDARPVTDSERDIVSEGSNPGPYPIPPERLRVFPTDDDLPADQLNTRIDELFVPIARPAAPQRGRHDAWKQELLSELRRVSFGYFPETIPPAKVLEEPAQPDETGYLVIRVETEPGIRVPLRFDPPMMVQPPPRRIVLVVRNADTDPGQPRWVDEFRQERDRMFWIEPRGIGSTRWTRKNPPNYVERSHVLLGRTVDTGRVHDVIAAARFLKERFAQSGSPEHAPELVVAGRGPAGLIAAYAVALCEDIAAVTLVAPPATHDRNNSAPQFLNVLRVCDVPDVLGLIAPRPLTIVGSDAEQFARTKAAYAAAEAEAKLSLE